MYEGYKFTRPYLAKDGRLRIVGVDKDKKHHTISYPRYLMEMYLGRYLDKDEQIDHIDGNPLNNEIKNLRIIKKGEHQYQDAKRNRDVIVYCKMCGKPFLIKGSNLYNRNRKDRNQSGYFCSRHCVGKYSRLLQLGKIEVTKEDRIIPMKYKIKDEI